MLATSIPAKIEHSRFDHHMEFAYLSSFVLFGEISALMHFAFLLSLCPRDLNLVSMVQQCPFEL
jgi:hypothetical protein